jgi:MFS family permease
MPMAYSGSHASLYIGSCRTCVWQNPAIERHSVPHAISLAASVFFFWAGILSASSYPVAARLAAHFGLVNTMVFTHIPSNLFLILAAYSSNLYVTLGLLLLRSALSQMDVPTRTSYVMAVVTPPERATAASVTAVPRSLASAISPTFAGLLLTTAFPSLPLIVCGSLKILYDFALLYSFHHLKPPEERVRSAAAK